MRMNLNVGVSVARGTNINDIVVPEQLRRRCRTGLEFFDDAVGGQGLVPSAVMMLTGTPGAGKSTMLLQLADSITSQGHVCLYNTGEESLYQVKMVSERLKLSNGFYVGQDINVNDLLDHADALRKRHAGQQFFLLQDSLQTLDDGKYNGLTNSVTPLRCVEAMTDWAKNNYTNVVFIGQVNKDGIFAGKNGILHAVDVRAHLYVDTKKTSETYGERIFEITKNRFGCSGRAYIMGIDETGLYDKGSIGVNE